MSVVDEAQEKVVIQEYLRRYNLFEDCIINYPNPPDCTFQQREKKEWIEVTCAYRLFKKFTPTKGHHKPFGTYEYGCPLDKNTTVNQIISSVIERIIAKDSSANYKKFNQEYGLGSLLIFINDNCFHWQDHLEDIINIDNYKHLKLNTFEFVYIYNHPTVTNLVSTDPLRWEAKLLEGHENFHLILKK